MKKQVILLVILLIQSILVFTNLPDIPRWYWDDGVNMEVAWNLANGEMRIYSITYPFIPHPPFFFAVLAILLKTFGNQLIVLRSLTSILSLATTLLIYLTCKKISGEKLALTSAFMYAIYPDNIYWNRIGFANSMLMFLGILALYLFLSGRRMLSCLTVSIALVTQFMGIGFLFSVLAALYLRRDMKEMMRGFVLCISLPVITYTLIYFSPVRDALVFDLSYAVARFSGNIIVYSATFALLVAFYLFWRRNRNASAWTLPKRVLIAVKGAAVQDIKFMFGEKAEFILKRKPFTILVLLNLLWATRTLVPLSDEILFSAFDGVFLGYYWMGAFGIFLFAERLVALFFLPIFLVVFGFGRTDHMILPLYPFLSMGLGFLTSRVYEHAKSAVSMHGRKIAFSLTIMVLVYYPFGVLLVQDVNSFVYGNGLKREDVAGMRDVVSFIDDNTKSDDIVIATSHVCRLVDARCAEIFQGLVAEGKNISYYGRILPEERFVFNSSFKNARFIVLFNDSLDKFEKEDNGGYYVSELSSWPIVHTRREFVVCVNPSYDVSAVEDKPGPDNNKGN
ncbi:MAG: glycosyltransferase family 39 protein [Candidatus Altiarchaeota archaeon]